MTNTKIDGTGLLEDLRQFKAAVWDLRKTLFLINNAAKKGQDGTIKNAAESSIDAVTRLIAEMDKAISKADGTM